MIVSELNKNLDQGEFQTLNQIKNIHLIFLIAQDMSFDFYNKNRSTGLLSTTIPKRQNAWNTIEPGDPYDIRKSMIARLPGESKTAMGDHLEIVCLLQAAQIQRLIDHLDDYKLRLKEIERKDLDRHSYEIQIKELTERAFDGDRYKKESDKLRQFIQKQTVELEEYKKRVSEIDSNIQVKYHKALKQIESMHKDNTDLKDNLNKITSDIATWKAKFEALERTKNKEIEEIKQNFENNKRFELEIRELQNRLQSERAQFESEIKKGRDANEAKNREIEQLRVNIAQFSKKLQEYSVYAEKYEDVENKIGMATEEIERLNRVLKERNSELRDHQNKLFESETRSHTLESEFARIKNRFDSEVKQKDEAERKNMEYEAKLRQVNNITRRIAEYENKIGIIDQERERLQIALKAKNNELNDRDKVARDLEFETESSKRRINNLEARLAELNVLEEKVMQYQIKMSKMTNQIQNIDRERAQFDEIKKENDNLKRRVAQLGQANMKIGQYEYKIELAAREIERLNNIIDNKNREIQGLQSKCVEGDNSTRQLKNLSEQLRKIVDENKQLHEQLREGQQKLRISNAQQQKLVLELTQYKTRISGNDQQADQFKKKIQKLLQENTGLGDEVRNAQQALRLSTAQQNRIMAELTQHKEQNNQISDTYKLKMQKLMNENSQLGQEMRSAQQNLRLSAGQISKLNNELKITCNELEEARKRVQELTDVNRKLPQYQNKIALFSQQLERLNGVVQKKNSQIRALGGQVQATRENLRLSTLQHSRLSNELNEFKSQLNANNQESETYKQRIQKLLSQNTHLGEEVRGAQENLRLSASQIGKLNNELKIACNDIQELQKKLQQSSNFNRRIPELQNQVALLSQEVERLNSIVDKKNNEIRGLGGKLGETNQQSQALKIRIQKIQSQSNAFQGQIKTAQQNLRLSAGQIQKLTNQVRGSFAENQQLKKRLAELENQIKKVSGQGENKLRVLTQECQRLNAAIEKKNSEIRNLGGEVQQYQENLRLSTAQASKLGLELNDFKNRLGATTQESETYKQRIQKLLNENSSLGDEMRTAQQNLRLSAGQITKLTNEFKIVCNENEQLNKKVQQLGQRSRIIPQFEKKVVILSEEIERLNGIIEKKNAEIGNLNKRLSEAEAMSQTISILQNKVAGLLSENKTLDGEVKTVQQNLRLSTTQNQRIGQQLNQYKNRIQANDEENKVLKGKIQKLLGENSSLGQDMQAAQENLRLSAAQASKLSTQLNDFKNRLGLTSQQSETYKQRIQKLLSENSNLGDEVRIAQENLRLSASQIGKLQNEFKLVCQEVDNLKKKLQQSDAGSKKYKTESESKFAILGQQLERLNALVEKRNNEIRALGGEVQDAQENLRLSAAQASKLSNELNEYRNRYGQSTQELDTYKQRIQKLLGENSALGDEMRSAQENLRLSAGTLNKLQGEFKAVCGDFDVTKKKLSDTENAWKVLKSESENKVALLSQECERLNGLVEKKNNEIRALGGEVQEAQENIRLSAAQASKLSNELNQYRNRYGQSTQELDTYKQRIQKLLGENSALGDEMRSAQENLRLSAGTLSKLQGEFKAVCGQLDVTKKKLSDTENAWKVLKSESENKVALLSQECERLNGLVEKKNNEIRALGGEVQEAQENIRLSAAQASKLSNELNQYRNRYGQSTQELDTYKQRIQKLLGENSALGDEMRSAQENLRLSAGTLSKLQGEFKAVCGQLDVTKKKLSDTENAWKVLKSESENKVALLSQECERLNGLVEKKNNEIRALGGEVQEAQENIRLSAAQASKLSNELNEFRNRYGQSTQQIDTYKQRIQKLLGENSALGDQMRSAQENLRLSSGTLSKLQGEFKSVCGQYDQAKKRIVEYEMAFKKFNSQSENKVKILTQECERLNALVEKRNAEVRALGGQVQDAQQNLRLSAAQTSKLTGQLNEFKNRYTSTTQQSEAYKQRIQKLLAQNSSLGEQVRTAQENVRLSTGQIGRLTAEFKGMLAQNEQFKKKVQDYETQIKRLQGQSQNKVQILTKECERLNALVEKRNSEIRALGGEVQEAQENLRLSAAQSSKLSLEINEFKNRLGQSNQQSETYKLRLQKLLGENSALGEEMRAAQENLRLSAGTMSKLQNELKIVCNDNEQLKKKLDEIGGKKVPEFENRINILSQEIQRLNGVLEKKNIELGNLHKKLAQIDNMNKTIGSLQEKITKLVTENTSIEGQFRNVQENLRLSANQNKKIIQQLTDYKNKIAANEQENNVLKQKMNNLVKENSNLDEEVRNAQENLRLSANQMSKLNAQLNQYKSRIDLNNQESDTYRQKIQKLLSENTSLNEQVRNAQENLRLSAGQMSKLQNEFKLLCAENEELKRRVLESDNNFKKTKSDGDNKLSILSQQLERLNALVEKRNNEIRALGGEVQDAQENLRLSAAQASKLSNELNEYRNRYGQSTQELDTYKQRIQKLLGENSALGDEMRSAQENLRLSAGTLNKLQGEFKAVCGDFDVTKKKLSDTENAWKVLKSESENKVALLSQECERLNGLVEKKNNEIRALGGEVQEAQENIRLSAAQASKLSNELNQYRNRYGQSTQELDTYKQRIQKLLGENSALGDEMRSAQENLRLSAGTLSKLQGEFKAVCGQLDVTKKKLSDTENAWKVLKSESENKVALLSQECERLNGLVEKKNNEIRALGGEVQEAQENIRLSAAQASKLSNELNQYRNRYGQSTQELDTYKQRIQKLLGENSALGDEMRSAQENLRLSAGTLSKLQGEFKAVCGQLDVTKKKLSDTENAWKVLKSESENKVALLSQECERLNGLVEKKNNEIRALGGEVQEAQENIRLSAAQASKLSNELNEFRNRYGQSTQQIDTYKQRIQKLLGENSALGDQMRSAQENLRLSSGTLSKLQGEFKSVCGQYDQAKKRIVEYEMAFKKFNSQSENKVKILTQECERLNALVEKRNAEVRALGGQVQDAQQNLRLSAAQTSKLTGQLNEFKNRYTSTTQQSEAYKQRIQKLLAQNSSLGEQVRTAQENVRLSTGQIGRLTAEFKGMLAQNEQFKKKVQDYETQIKRLQGQSQNKVQILTKECERLNALVEKRNSEIRALGGEVQEAQENLRLSAAQSSKLSLEINEFKNRLGQSNQQSETYKLRLQKLLGENSALGEEMRAAQENLRLSAGTMSKLQNELKIVCNDNEQLKKKLDEIGGKKVPEFENRINILSQEIQRLNGVLEKKNIELGNLHKKLAQIDNMNKTIGSLQEKITKLVTENTSIEGQFRNVQENLRLSANQNKKIIQQLTDYKNKIAANEQENNVLKQKMNNLVKENSNLDEEVRNAQENLRLSANQMSKLNAQLNQYKSRIDLNNQESDTYRQKIQKLLSENTSLNEQVRNAQENLRLSAGQMSKLQNEFKLLCAENEELKRRVLESDNNFKKTKSDGDNKLSILTQQCERLNALVQRRNNEIRALGGQVQEAQENLRLSAAQSSKLNQQLNDVKNRYGQTSQQSETYKQRIQKLLSENTSLNDEVKNAQQNLRLSAGQVNKLQNEFKNVCNENEQLKSKIQQLLNSNRKIAEYQNKIALLSQEIERLNGFVQKKNSEVNGLNKRLNQIDSMNKTIGNLQQKINRLVHENTEMEGEVRSAQDNIRLSANQNAKIMAELNEYKMRIQQNNNENNVLKQKMQKITSENTSLNEQVRTAQETLRLSSATQAKLNAELNQYKQQINSNNKETETYRLKIQKIMAENTSLVEEVRGVQENLRLSSGTINKLNNELKATCSENEQLRRKLQEAGTVNKKIPEYENKLSLLSQEIERLNGIIDKKNTEIKNLKETEVEAETMARQVRQLSDQMKKVSGQNENLYNEIRGGQEQIRLSNAQISKLRGENDEYKFSIEELKKRAQDVTTSKVSEYEAKIALFSQEIERLNSVVEKKNGQISNLSKKLNEIDEMNRSIGSLQEKIKKLVNENYSFEEEMRSAQQNLRLSANQNAKMVKELNDYKQKIESNNQQNEALKGKMNKLLSENSSLGEEVKNAQESLRLSSATQAKLQRELNEYKGRINENNQQSETYRIKIQKLVSENSSLNDQVRGVQENLRLSSGTISKLTNELKITCNENEDLKKKLEEALKYKARCLDFEQKIILLSAEIQRLRNISNNTETENEGSKKKLLEYETKFTKISVQFEKLNNIIQELRKENQTLKQSNYDFEMRLKSTTFTEDKVKVLNEEIDRLSRLVEEKEEDLGEIKLRFSDEAALVKRIQQHLALFVVLFAEIESLRKRVKDKEKEVEDVRRSSLAPYRN